MPAYRYRKMLTELRKLNCEIGKIAKQNADRHLEERKVRTMGPSKETLRRLRIKAENLKSINGDLKQQEGPTLVKRK